MRSTKITYAILAVAVIAIGLSIRAYIQLGTHPALPADVPPAPSPIIASLLTTSSTAPATPAGVPNKKITPAKADAKVGTQTAAVVPNKPVAAAPETPTVTPVVVYDPVSLPYSVTDFSSKKTWRAIIGSVDIKTIEFSKRNYLRVAARADTTVGLIELGGSEAWKNYTYTLNTNFISGTAFSLIARYTDSKNYVDCTFSEGGSTTIYSIVNGKSNTVAEHTHEIPTIPNVVDIHYGIKVDGDKVQCIVNGTTVNATVPEMSSAGGIGVQVYNQALGTSELDIQTIEVDE